jgi:hypothetical protein
LYAITATASAVLRCRVLLCSWTMCAAVKACYCSNKSTHVYYVLTVAVAAAGTFAVLRDTVQKRDIEARKGLKKITKQHITQTTAGRNI